MRNPDRNARCHVWIVGDIAVGRAACATTGNHDVSGYLLIKTAEGGRIAAQDWDAAADCR